MTSSEIASLQLEGVSPIITELLKSDFTLESSFSNTSAQRVGTTAYRVTMKYARPGHAETLDLDAGTLGLGSSTKFNKGTIVPFVYQIPVNFSQLVKMVGVKQDAVGIKDVVTDLIADVAKQLRNWNDILLNTAGYGNLAQLSGAVSTRTYPIKGGFGARLLGDGLIVDCCITNDYRDTTNKVIEVLYRTNSLGGTQSVTASTNYTLPTSAADGDYLRFKGLTTAGGSPTNATAIFGLPYFINTSTAGTVLDITKLTAPYTVSNGFDIGTAQVSLPVFRALINQIQARLEGDPMSGGFFHTHRSQVASYEELGFPLQTIPMAGGTAPNKLDLFFGTSKGEGFTVAGISIKQNDHADNTVWHFVQPDAWGKVQYGDGPFWYPALPNSKIYPLYSTTTGTPKTAFGATMVHAAQYYSVNQMAQGVISNCGLPVLN